MHIKRIVDHVKNLPPARAIATEKGHIPRSLQRGRGPHWLPIQTSVQLSKPMDAVIAVFVQPYQWANPAVSLFQPFRWLV